MCTNVFITSLPVIIVTVFIAVVYQYLRLPKQNLQQVRNIITRDNQPITFAHRAGQCEAPENTLLAIETAFKNGARGVEVDLQYTSDGVAVLLHDYDVSRTTNGSGQLSDMPYDVVKTLNAAAHFDYTLTSDGRKDVAFEGIPTLMDAVALCRKHNMVIDLDVKSSGVQICKTLSAIRDVYPDAPNFIFVTSFFPNIIYQVRTGCPEYVTGMIWYKHYISREITGEPRFPGFLTLLLDGLDVIGELLKKYVFPDVLGLSLVVVHKDELSARDVRWWRGHGVEVVTWTVNQPIEKEYLLKKEGVPVITDSVTNRDDCGEQVN